MGVLFLVISGTILAIIVTVLVLNKSRLLKERKESVQAGLIVGGIVLFLFAGFAAVAGLKNTLCLFRGMGLFALLRWANVSETDLHEKIEIPTDFGETLSWKYLCFVRENPIIWNVPTEILYAENDNLISRQTVNEFISNHNTHLTVMENGEHWFHTDEQLAFLDSWMKKAIG